MPIAILPKRIDNDYRGRTAGLALLAVIMLFRAVMSASSIFLPHSTAVNADQIPVDSAGPVVGQYILAMFALLGSFNAMLVALGVLVLVRYRTMAPLLYLALIFEFVARKLINLIYRHAPLATWPHSFPSFITQALFVLMIVGLALSLWPRRA